MRILVCGGRDFLDFLWMRSVIEDTIYDRETYANEFDDTTIIHGGALGADYLAKILCHEWKLKEEEYKADWKKYGSKAGPIRNQKMLDEGKPDLVLAFPTPKSRGTWDMVQRAKNAGVEVVVYEAKR